MSISIAKGNIVMGMAVGQARLLSITSRMSDNELRAQIVNNNKMRLATESSQVSEAYIAALNESQLMFTNYDANDNINYQQLTYNALTNFKGVTTHSEGEEPHRHIVIKYVEE